MNALEFSGKIENGAIRLPKQYTMYDDAEVRVIVLIETMPHGKGQKERLKSVFQKMGETPMFSTIADPSAWQKKLRDEWE